MKCCKEKISFYIDGEMSGAEKEAFSKHLGLCISCARLVNELHSQKEMVEGLFVGFESSAPIELKSRVMARIEERNAFNWWPVVLRRIAIAGCMAGLVFALMMSHPKKKEEGYLGQMMTNSIEEKEEAYVLREQTKVFLDRYL
ncbi:MAG: zf-HC2 domain-containing protein [bacterium]